MKQKLLLVLTLFMLLLPSLSSANPNGVGNGTFDAQCGGACHGDANQNKTSPSIIHIQPPSVAYEGLLTSITVNIDNVQTTDQRLLGVFLLTGLSGAGDTPEDDGWTVISNSAGGIDNYAEVHLSPSQHALTMSWTLRAPSSGVYPLYAAIHHGMEDGSEAPFYGVSNVALLEVKPVPENLPRFTPSFTPPSIRHLGQETTITMTTQNVDGMTIEWQVGEETPHVETLTSMSNGTWSFVIPASLQPNTVQWRAIMQGDGPEQTSPWFQLTSEAPRWSVDEPTAYLQSVAMLMAMMVGFLLLQLPQPRSKHYNNEAIEMTEDGGEE